MPTTIGMIETRNSYIDAINFGRATIAALSYVNQTEAREVHIMRLSTAFRRAGISTSLRYALSVLTMLREVENLNQGYWQPTPNRVVAIDHSLYLLVSISPTLELQRHLASVRNLGRIRTIDKAESHIFPSQALDHWLGKPPASTLTWTEDFISLAKKTLQPTRYSGSIEFFDIYRSRTGIWCPKWSESLPAEVRATDGIVLARHRLTATSNKYFVAQVSKGQVWAESNLPVDAERLQFGLAGLEGKRMGCRAERRGGSCAYQFNFQLPRQERRLLLALASRQPSIGTRLYLVEGLGANNAIRNRFDALGIEIGDV